MAIAIEAIAILMAVLANLVASLTDLLGPALRQPIFGRT
jgi:hypothetical protein